MFCLQPNFLFFFKKKIIFRIFKYFQNNQLHIVKSVYAFCFNKHTTAWSAHFLTFILSRLVSTSGFNVKL